MYGLVNKAVQEMVTELHGDTVWQTILDRAGIDIDHFIGLESYPDEVTYKLVGAACEVLNAPAEAILESFGEYWVLYTGRTAYGPMLTSYGSDAISLLRNLDSMHRRISLSMPHLKPPRFKCTDDGDRSIQVHYYSERDGLAPMVIGLLRGCGQLFGTPADVEQVASKAAGADHDVFLFRLR